MKARIEPFQDGLGEVRYRVIAETALWAAAQRAVSEVEAINEAGFVPTPFGGKGEPFDPPENASQAVSGEYAPTAVYRVSYQGQGRIGLEAIPESEWKGPPNCDGDARYGQEPTQAGQVLAQAQHEAAEDGEGCGSVACAMTRGVND